MIDKIKAEIELKDFWDNALRPKIENDVRQLHIKDYGKDSSYCSGCVEQAVILTLEECLKWAEELEEKLKERVKQEFDQGDVDGRRKIYYLTDKDCDEILEVIEKAFHLNNKKEVN